MAQKQKKPMRTSPAHSSLFHHLVRIISETNGISLQDTLELATNSAQIKRDRPTHKHFREFRELLSHFQQYSDDIELLLRHPVGSALHEFFRLFPLPYQDQHIHLTGSLTPDFIYENLKPYLAGPDRQLYEKHIRAVFGKNSLPIRGAKDVEALIHTNDGETFFRFLEVLFLPKLILTNRDAHRRAAYHIAKSVYENYNVGKVHLKFTLSRASKMHAEQIPGTEDLTPQDVILGLYEGFRDFKKEYPQFSFVLSPSFRKEPEFYDAERFKSKKDDFMNQVETILAILAENPELQPYMNEVDTVGSEKELYRKAHFAQMQRGFRRLHRFGFSLKSHHGETWHTLNRGIQAVDNAMNIWHIDTLEHGISLGVNPNFYFHTIFEKVLEWNKKGVKLNPEGNETKEIVAMDWEDQKRVLAKLLSGKPLSQTEIGHFRKVKFYTAVEVEHYQHDVLNRMIDKEVTLTSLPSSNKKLTGQFPDYKDHPFSWWEKKAVKQAIGTDNYVTLGTNFIQEMIILLLSDPKNLKITKLLMVATGEQRRPYLSKMLWDMRESLGIES